MIEHAATASEDAFDYDDGPPTQPIEPEGASWSLVCAVVIPTSYPSFKNRIIWYWTRQVSE